MRRLGEGRKHGSPPFVSASNRMHLTDTSTVYNPPPSPRGPFVSAAAIMSVMLA
jgi:hypothetical protein